MKKNVGISISKCLKSAAKNRRTNQTARAILSPPTVLLVQEFLPTAQTKAVPSLEESIGCYFKGNVKRVFTGVECYTIQ
jgi:hypothetical protein